MKGIHLPSFSRRPRGGGEIAPPRGRRLNGVFAFLIIAIIASAASAHPVGEKSYDRTIVVAPDGRRPGPVAYELEVNTATVAQDLADLGDEIDLSKCRLPARLLRCLRPLSCPGPRRPLDVRLDGQAAAPSTCTEYGVRGPREGQPARAVPFRGPWPPLSEQTHRFTFRDGTYEELGGRIRLSLAPTERILLAEATAPSATLQAKPLTLLAPGDADRLREASATFRIAADSVPRGQLKLAPLPDQRSRRS